nr:hypothetical protein HUO10_000849 [Paraburkholderia busanensis]
MESAHYTSSQGRLTVLASAAMLLAACGGGTNGAPQATFSPPAIQGTVASGNPVVNAAVTAIDINGKTATATADTHGNYTLVTSALTAPIALVATDPSGQVSPMVSVLASLPTAGQTTTSNVTTLTTALSALLTSDGNPLDFVTPGAATTLSAITAPSLKAATSTLDTYLTNLLAATGLPADFDPVGTNFTANHTGADALIDMVSVVPEGAVTYLVYKTPSTASSQSAAYLTLNNTSTPSNVPVAPAVSASAVANLVSLQTYLSTLPAALQSCGAAGGTGAACSSLIDANYLDNGFSNITQYDSDLNSSHLNLNGSVPNIVSVNSAGNRALIGIPYGLSSATGNQGQYTLYTTVQQTPSGTWDIIGNQLPYNLSVSTRTTYRNFLDSYIDPTTGKPDVPFFDAGVNLSVGSLGAGRSGASISYVNVTGPGLPGGTNCSPAATSASSPCGVWLAKDSSGDMNLLSAAPSAALTSPPTSGISGTSEYRWSWAPSTYTPPASVGYWIAGGTPVNLATLPPNAVYQFTLYNSSGTSLGTYSVTNPNSFADATLGQNAYNAGYFPVLGSDVTANFLTPTGSLANIQTSMSVDFTPPPVNSPLTTTGVFIQSRDNNNDCDVESSNVPVLPGVTSATVTAPSATCANGTAMAFWAINSASDPAFRLVQLKSRNASGVLFYFNQAVRSSSSARSAS